MYPSMHVLCSDKDTLSATYSIGKYYKLGLTIGDMSIDISVGSPLRAVELINTISEALVQALDLIDKGLKLPCGEEPGGCSAAGSGCGGCGNNPEVG